MCVDCDRRILRNVASDLLRAFFVDEATKSTDFGLGLGMNYEFSDVIFANARYQAGLTEIGDSEAGGNSVKNSVFQIGLGFRF